MSDVWKPFPKFVNYDENHARPALELEEAVGKRFHQELYLNVKVNSSKLNPLQIMLD